MYIGKDDKEVPVGMPGLFQEVAELNAEAKAHRSKTRIADWVEGKVRVMR